MKFNKEKLRLGARFYQVVSDEEYFTYSLVHIDEKKNRVTLMHEETFEIEEVPKKTLDEDYVLLINYYKFDIYNYRPKANVLAFKDLYKPSIWYENNVLKLYDTSSINVIYYLAIALHLYIYPFITKNVFYKMLNYIVQLNCNTYRLMDSKYVDDYKTVYDMYMDQIFLHYYVLDINESDYGTVYKYEDKDTYLLNDNIIEKAEEMLDKPILTYDCYLWTEEINLNNVSLPHFWVYLNDTYYFVLYIEDTTRSSALVNKNLQDHIDVVEFMLK